MTKQSYFILISAILVIICVIIYKPLMKIVDDIRDPVYICIVDSNLKDGTTRTEDFELRQSQIIPKGFAIDGYVFDKVTEFEGEYTSNTSSDMFPFSQLNCKKE